MSYGASLSETYRQVGVYAGKILRGAKPDDLPVSAAHEVRACHQHEDCKDIWDCRTAVLLIASDELIE